ncbi:MAG: hypothetical protein WAN48_05075 [Actinomycetes bacterium]
MRTVVLHIGAMKTGTSYIQSILASNRELLAERGVLFPGQTWRHQRKATQDLLAKRQPTPDGLGSWAHLADEVRSFDGDRAVISMEFLSFASREVAERAVGAFAPDEVRVVLSLRDLARVIPAQWQETTQNMRDWPYAKYLDDLMSEQPRKTEYGPHFWNRQRWPRILRAWQPWVTPDNLVVVTVPPSGSPSNVLWERFCEASGIASDGFDLKGFDNDSLGGVSAELMRRVSHEAAERGLDDDEYHVLKSQLAKRTLVHRRRSEPAILIPPSRREWTDRTSRLMIDEVKQIGALVVGDLEELMPRWPDVAPANATSDPGGLSSDELLDAAIDGLIGLAARVPGPRRSSRRATVGNRP